MRTLFILTGLIISSFWSVAQEKSTKELDHSIKEWTTFTSNDQILVEFKFADCEAEIGYDKELILLRFTNKTEETVEINWHEHLYYNGLCKTCDYPQEYTYILKLAPNQSVSGDCEMGSDHRLTIFSKFNDSKYTGGSQLTDFDLNDLKVNSIK